MRNGCAVATAILAITLPVILRGAPVRADDVPPAPRPAPSWNWTGFYAGGHVGAFKGTTTFSDPDGPAPFGGSVGTPGFLAGLQLGYNWQAAPQLVLGVEAEATLLSGYGANTCVQSSPNVIGSNCKVTPRELATLTGRLGFVTEPRGRTLLYGKAGVAWMRADASINPNNTVNSQDQGFLNGGFTFSDVPAQGEPVSGSISAWGPTVGAGVEYALGSAWSLKMEYNYMYFGGMSLPTPATSNITASGDVTNPPSSGSSNITQNLHIARVGLNYHFGGGARRSEADGSAAPDGVAWTPGWEFEAGARYWYSSGSYQNSNGAAPYSLVSHLSYNNLAGYTGELFGRVDSPVDIFVKGFIGGGAITQGQMYDEDWGLSSALAGAPTAYEITQSNVSGSLHYLTADIGYNVMRGPDHKVGLFVGYNLYQTALNATGCSQLVQPSSGVCYPAISSTTPVISQTDIWQSVRVGVSAEVRIWEHLKLGGDFAYLPYVSYNGLDSHWQRSPAALFPFNGTGNGVQAEIVATYNMTEAFSIGVGGRYWAMWTNLGSQMDSPSNNISASTDRYGVFAQASYKFNVPK